MSYPHKNNLTTLKRRAISSYGIILFTIDKGSIKYLLCQRRDSISYAEFLKNNLPPELIPYHIGLMSHEERKRCCDYYAKNDVQSLWDDLWINHNCRIYQHEMSRCCNNFRANMEKYMSHFLNLTTGQIENTWGFAKGRKHSYENEITCAVREFEEETQIPQQEIQLQHDCNPYEEYYTGTDGKLYRTVYFLAYIPFIPEVKPGKTLDRIRTEYISGEISQIQWLSFTDAIKKLDTNKVKILRQIDEYLLFKKRRIIKQRGTI